MSGHHGTKLINIVIHSLELHSVLTADEKSGLNATFAVQRDFRAGHDLVKQGEKPAFVGALLSGMLCRSKMLASGARQTVSFSLPGEIFDLQSFVVETFDHSIRALTRSTVATASHEAVEAMIDVHPRLGVLLLRDALAGGSILREWIVNCGRRTAYERLAHLFCEIYVRSAGMGLVSGGACAFPVTQADLSDATGLSVVHVNRVLQQLRAENLLKFAAGRLTVHDFNALAHAAGFDPAYLRTHDKLRDEPGRLFGRRALDPARRVGVGQRHNFI